LSNDAFHSSASSSRGVVRTEQSYVTPGEERNKAASAVSSKNPSLREPACPQASRDWNIRPWCRILIKVSVPGISSPGAALRGVPTSSNGPWPVMTLPTKVPSDSLGRIGSLKRTSDKSPFPMALRSCGHRITHQLRPINMNGRSILSVMSALEFEALCCMMCSTSFLFNI